mmetsp:Transcript_114170/g.178483  ORF Transcript_114170/g.178483 Transcript_114170/m.178483 type:complete len:200 (-) Transcript_114170:815-1414(-)
MMCCFADPKLSKVEIVPPTIDVCTHSAISTVFKSSTSTLHSPPDTDTAEIDKSCCMQSWMYAGILIDKALTNSRNRIFTKEPPSAVLRPKQWHVSSTAASSVNGLNATSNIPRPSCCGVGTVAILLGVSTPPKVIDLLDSEGSTFPCRDLPGVRATVTTRIGFRVDPPSIWRLLCTAILDNSELKAQKTEHRPLSSCAL